MAKLVVPWIYYCVYICPHQRATFLRVLLEYGPKWNGHQVSIVATVKMRVQYRLEDTQTNGTLEDGEQPLDCLSGDDTYYL